RSAFAATGAPESDFNHAAAAVDEVSHAWLDTRAAVCTDTRDRHVQPEASLLVRLACLDRQQEDLSALLALFGHADADIARTATRLDGAAVFGLHGELIDAWTTHAKAWIERDGDVEAESILENALGLMAISSGDHEAALTHSQRAEVLATQVHGPAGQSVFADQ